jgi:UDP-N-acetylmuramate dehydrogenase
VTFSLRLSTLGEPVRYAELARALEVQIGERAPLTDVRAAVLALRRRKGMVLDAADPDTRSAGSFFTNPLLTGDQLASLQQVFPDVPTWAEPDGRSKVSAAWLIERSGFGKGAFDGPVGISTKHTLALVNRGGGTAADLRRVARAVRDGVRALRRGARQRAGRRRRAALADAGRRGSDPLIIRRIRDVTRPCEPP